MNDYKNNDFGMIVIKSFIVLLCAVFLPFMLWVFYGLFLTEGLGVLFAGISPALLIFLGAYAATGGK